MQMVEVRPLKPFVGSYKCGLSEADVIDDALVEKDGVITKMKVPRKKYKGQVEFTRAAWPEETQLHREGKLPGHLRAADDMCMFVTVVPSQGTVFLPKDVAENLIQRRLAEHVNLVEEPRESKKLPSIKPEV